MIGLSIFLKNIEFHGILLDSLFDENQSDKIKSDKLILIELIRNGFKSGPIVPIRSTLFDIDSTEEAFKYMSSGKHIGKVLIEIREERYEDSRTEKKFRYKNQNSARI